ncbi:hypothetical protein HFX_6241 (plasmid) [Haloferax mediterranei ATCC 33500]|uniref:Uncharacterized protein n=1 Tax=Haloferax mediterranei (strain ATCC 33500 / DSM 1411 / JCM 8866 / NBRC 14739 / NCIMB 2177 / R-4) TaxID=523841 RepID=I3RAV3_HALMT|nr:hypothetical protein HFX_6241 [Haloferax mediterranei ATCC 33500]
MYDFSVASVSRANLFVCRTLDFAAGVSRRNLADAVEFLERSFDTPETAAAERCCLRTSHSVGYAAGKLSPAAGAVEAGV